MGKNKYYVVWKGRKTGVFSDWISCKSQVEGFQGALYKAFSNISEANIAFGGSPNDYLKDKSFPLSDSKLSPAPKYKAIAVDAACSGNPGNMEYRGVWIDTREEIFKSKIYRYGTNNIGEFLALVHILAICKEQVWNYDIYSDSRNAILWLEHGKCKTKLELTPTTQELFDVIRRAEIWLAKNNYSNKIIKWDTSSWGEIPADFGRK